MSIGFDNELDMDGPHPTYRMSASQLKQYDFEAKKINIEMRNINEDSLRNDFTNLFKQYCEMLDIKKQKGEAYISNVNLEINDLKTGIETKINLIKETDKNIYLLKFFLSELLAAEQRKRNHPYENVASDMSESYEREINGHLFKGFDKEYQEKQKAICSILNSLCGKPLQVYTGYVKTYTKRYQEALGKKNNLQNEIENMKKQIRDLEDKKNHVNSAIDLDEKKRLDDFNFKEHMFVTYYNQYFDVYNNSNAFTNLDDKVFGLSKCSSLCGKNITEELIDDYFYYLYKNRK